jgi:hypothetical protein
VFASKLDLPDHFGARVTAIHVHVRDAQASQSTSSRREAVARALIESCDLLGEVNVNAVSYELAQIMTDEVSLSQIKLMPLEVEKFLEIERQLLREAGVGESAIQSIDNLCRQVRRLREYKLSAENIIEQLIDLQELVCSQRDEAIARARKRLRAPDVWMAIAGTTVLLTNAGAMYLGVPQAAMSSAMGGAMIGRALK